MVIRLFDPLGDAQPLRVCIIEQQDFHRAIEPSWPPGSAIVSDYLDYLQHQCEEHDGVVIVAEAGGQIVGFTCVVASAPGASPDDPAAHAWVHDLFVRSNYRHQGIATKLMAEAETFARERGARTMRLGVLDGNAVARAFYRANAFRDYVRVLTKYLH